MNFNKLGIAVLSAGAIFMATSCNKTQTLNLEKATKWVEEHGKKESYVKTNPKSGVSTANFAASTGEQTREFLKEAMELDKNMKATKEMPKESLETVYYLNSVDFKSMYTEETIELLDAVFTLTGNSFSIKTDYSDYLQYLYFTSGTATLKQSYNSSGKPTKIVITLQNCAMDGADGVANGTITTTYKY